MLQYVVVILYFMHITHSQYNKNLSMYHPYLFSFSCKKGRMSNCFSFSFYIFISKRYVFWSYYVCVLCVEKGGGLQLLYDTNTENFDVISFLMKQA